MDQAVMRAMAKWPAVPAVVGWVAVEEGGKRRVRNSATGKLGRIGNSALREFICLNYAQDAPGRCFFQTGPQAV